MPLDQQALIAQLKDSNPRFAALYLKHHQLNNEIAELEGPNGAGYNDNVVRLKKEKLHVKDEMQRILAECQSVSPLSDNALSRALSYVSFPFAP